MFSRLFVRSTLVAALAATLLVPAAQADDWGRDKSMQVDPAIAAAIRDRANLTPAPVALDPAIQAALLERAASVTRPDDRSGTRGVGSLLQPQQAQKAGDRDWSNVGFGAGATFVLLLAFGSLLAVRHARARVTNA
jgi:hypothetical protein